MQFVEAPKIDTKINSNNTSNQELGDSSFNLNTNLLTNSDGIAIDISNLQESPAMERQRYKKI